MSAREIESQIAQLYAVIDRQNVEIEALRRLVDDILEIESGKEPVFDLGPLLKRARELRGKV